MCFSIHSAECNSWPYVWWTVRGECCVSGYARFFYPSSSTTLATGWTLNRTTCCIFFLMLLVYKIHTSTVCYIVIWFYTHNPRTSWFSFNEYGPVRRTQNCLYILIPIYYYIYVRIRTPCVRRASVPVLLLCYCLWRRAFSWILCVVSAGATSSRLVIFCFLSSFWEKSIRKTG